MRISLRLADHDRERLGCPEWMDVDIMSVTAREAAALQRGVQLPETGDRIAFATPGAWRKALLGREAVDEHGDTVMVDLVDDEGEPLREEDGTPKRRPLREPDFHAELVLTWLALRRAGILLPLSEVDFDTFGREWRYIPDEETGESDDGDGQGKDPPSIPPTTSN